MKILVTGGAGFQGSHLVEALLRAGHSVTVFNTCSDRAKKILSTIDYIYVDVIWGSVTDKEAVLKSVRDHDVVFHLAARINVDESRKDPELYEAVNVGGTLNILEAVRQTGARLIFASSCEVYGDGHNLTEDEALSESSEMRPNSPYAAFKAAADRLCYAYFKTFDVNVTIVRPFNVYGERQKKGTGGALIPILLSKAMKGEDVTVFGDGMATRDYSHVSDIVAGYMMVLESPFRILRGRAINFASGVNVSVRDIASRIADAFGVKVVHGPSRPGEVSRFPADISFARSIGYSAQVDIWDGIDRYIAWAKENQ